MTRFSCELLVVTLSVAVLFVACESSETKVATTSAATVTATASTAATPANADSKSSSGNSTNVGSYSAAIDGLKDLLLSSRGVDLARTAFSSLRGTFSTPLTALVYLGSLAAGAIVSLAFYEPSAGAGVQSAGSQMPNLMNLPGMMNLSPEAAAEMVRYPGNFVPGWTQVGQPSPAASIGAASSNVMPAPSRELNSNAPNSNQGVNRDINNQQSASDQHFVHVRPPPGFIHRRVEHVATPPQHHTVLAGKKNDHKVNTLVDKDQRKSLDPLAIVSAAPSFKSSESRHYPTYEAPTYQAPNGTEEIKNSTEKKIYDILMPRMSHQMVRTLGA